METAGHLARLRTRLPLLLCLWGAAVVSEAVLYYFFLRQPYFRALGLPFAAAVLIAAVVWTWHVLRPRADEDRRQGERRHARRRDVQRGAGE